MGDLAIQGDSPRQADELFTTLCFLQPSIDGMMSTGGTGRMFCSNGNEDMAGSGSFRFDETIAMRYG